MKSIYGFRYYQGVRYVAPHKPAPATFARCGSCGRAWDDDKPTGLTPAPSGRCPFEYMHKAPKPEPTRRAPVAPGLVPDMLSMLEECSRHLRNTPASKLMRGHADLLVMVDAVIARAKGAA